MRAVIERVQVQRGAYYDSMSLMLLSRDANEIDGMTNVAIVMATPLNLELLSRDGFQLPRERPGSNDLVLAFRAHDEAALEAADDLFGRWLSGRTQEDASLGGAEPFRNVGALSRQQPAINLLVVSVPGPHSAYEVGAGLEAGLNVFCFSSGMSTDEERALKAFADQKDLLFLGPDCGTAILDGIGVGFANVVRRGDVGIVGASGTGIQEVSCLLDTTGLGISQAVGVGGRDLSAEVGGTMSRRAMDLLMGDPDTRSIVVLSKPVGRDAMASLVAHADASPKPVVIGLLGATPYEVSEHVRVVGSLEAAAAAVAAIYGRQLPDEIVSSVDTTPGFIRGVFCGGSLCHEAASVATETIDAVWSNIAITGGRVLANVWESSEHTFLDLGDEAFTEGRLHPMIDPTLRNERASEEGLDPSVGVLLLDVVLGFGAHPDPADSLAPLIARLVEARAGSLTVIVSICGTDADPQGLADQRQRIEAAGATVTQSVAHGARLAVLASGSGVAQERSGATR